MIDLGPWPWATDRRAFRSGAAPSFAGISGGRTSAMMAALLDDNVRLCFQNTGREHPNTLIFLDKLEAALGREIVWLEWRPPPKKGDPPRMFGFEQVDFCTASRNGEPFRGMLEALRDYRATKGEAPVSPWARSRICTAYLKHRVMAKWIESIAVSAVQSPDLGYVDSYDWFVGLRKDEPDRVFKLKERETQSKQYRCPLSDAGITKPDVLSFWRRQSFNLELEDHQGNCTACFLKDQSDLARVLAEPETDADWWEAIGEDFGDFGGQRFPGYPQLRKEHGPRIAIESALRAGTAPINDGTLDARRFRLVMLQEKRRLAGERESFSCACEQTIAIADGLP